MALTKFTQQPHEQLDYDFDYTTWLDDHDGYTITSYVVAVDTGIQLVTHVRLDKIIKVVLTGGVSGTTYKATVRATVTSGDDSIELVKEFDILIKVKEL